jgi:hypothetical protein
MTDENSWSKADYMMPLTIVFTYVLNIVVKGDYMTLMTSQTQS